MKARRNVTHPSPRDDAHWIERLLETLGASPAFAESVLGDLAEEFGERIARDGIVAARRWYVREALRSAPHLARSAIRHLDARTRLRVLAVLAAGVLMVSLVLVWISIGAGPPVRLTAGTRDTVVVNHLRAISVPVRVLDADERVLSDSGVHYTWIGGARVDISSHGVITCLKPGDTRVRASLGSLATDVVVLCRPVTQARAAIWNDFILGDPPRELPAEFVGVDGEPVTLLSAHISIRDSAVATLNGLTIRPLRPGRTHVGLAIGDRWAGGSVRVFAPTLTIEGIRPATNPEQRLVAVPVRLAPGDSIQWRLPPGLLNLTFLPDTRAESIGSAAPTMRVDGPIMCMPALAKRAYNSRCLARGDGTTLTLTHPGGRAGAVVGSLALEWERDR